MSKARDIAFLRSNLVDARSKLEEKENEIATFRQRFADSQEKERQSREKNRRFFEQVFQRRYQGTSDSDSMNIIEFYEGQKKDLQDEIQRLREQVAGVSRHEDSAFQVAPAANFTMAGWEQERRSLIVRLQVRSSQVASDGASSAYFFTEARVSNIHCKSTLPEFDYTEPSPCLRTG